MAEKLADARLRYLENASKALYGPSPAISAHLQTVRQSIITEGDDEASPQSIERICTACGHTFILGRTCEDATKTSEKRTREDRLTQRHSSVKIVQFRCHKCGRKSEVEIPRPARQRGKQMLPQVPATTTTLPTGNKSISSLTAPLAPSAEQPPRKRPRNKKTSLQSILANQKTAESSPTKGFGLDLMDLMRP